MEYQDFTLPFERQYAQSLQYLLEKSKTHKMQTDRTGTGTWKKINQTFKIDLTKEPLPILHGKSVNPHSAIIEMLWFLKGDTNIKYLKENGVNYWDEWADPDGMLGRVYGQQFRDFNGIDQVYNMMDGLLNNFDSRRHIINLWNPKDLTKMNLPPCHFHYQLVTEIDNNDQKCMDVVGYQRSGDSFLGIPYNFLLFTIFGDIFAFYSGIKLRGVHHSIADFHLYQTHLESAQKYVDNVISDNENNARLFTKYDKYLAKSVEDRPRLTFDLNALQQFLDEPKSAENFCRMIDFMYQNPDCISWVNYSKEDHEPFIKAKIAV